MSFDELFIRTKFKDIEGYIEEIKDLLKSSDKEILDDSGRMHIAERLVQLVVDAILDINQYIIKEQNLRIFEDFQSTFYILAEKQYFTGRFR